MAAPRRKSHSTYHAILSALHPTIQAALEPLSPCPKGAMKRHAPIREADSSMRLKNGSYSQPVKD